MKQSEAEESNEEIKGSSLLQQTKGLFRVCINLCLRITHKNVESRTKAKLSSRLHISYYNSLIIRSNGDHQPITKQVGPRDR
jgi:hypothetical protein